MVRPCFLVLDPEHGASISTRKLVIETAKLNVITAYSSAELIATFQTFPAISGIVMNSNMNDMPCAEIVRAIRAVDPKIPIVLVGSPISPCEGDFNLESFNPAELLNVLRNIEPRKIEEILQRDAKLAENCE